MKSLTLSVCIVLMGTFALGCSDDEEESSDSNSTSNATTSNGTASNTTSTSNGTTATSNGTTATSNGTTATSNGTTATSNGTTSTSNGTTSTSNGTTSTSNGTTAGACDDYTPLKRPLFGDLHVHTTFSFDSYGLGNLRTTPSEAYRFARGEAIDISPHHDENAMRGQMRLERPLDFAAATDHSEYLGEVLLCTEEGLSPRAYNSLDCINFRNLSDFEENVLGLDSSFIGWGTGLGEDPPERPGLCDLPGANCEAASQDAWSRLKTMTNEAHAADPCVFTALHAYEWTGLKNDSMNHRNVIFRSDVTPPRPNSYVDTQNWEDLARELKRTCKDLGNGCDVLAIPHNPNYSGGLTFDPTDANGDSMDADTAALRAEMEPVVEIYQTKEESECRNGFSRYGAAPDEFCNFEKLKGAIPFCSPDEIACASDETPEDNGCSICLRECEEGETASIDACVSPLDYVRNAYKAGLEVFDGVGVNPFKMGVIGSTDTHNGTPGLTDEKQWEGHHGFIDDASDELLSPEENPLAVSAGPGGLAVVWAEENTRESIFDAIRRRETYATSGSRPIVRFFGGSDLPEDICDKSDMVEVSYAQGVAMGGDLPIGAPNQPPRFVVHAMQDTESAMLQQIHLVKVWLDDAGVPQEQVFDITPGNRDYSASVDLNTCTPEGPGQTDMCATWSDPNFNPRQPAIWYARVIENPTCRWTMQTCLEARAENPEQTDCDGEDDWAGCCDPDVPKTIHERAWTSPIFHEPR